MKKKKWMDVLVIFYLIIISVIIRSYYISAIDTLHVSGTYLTAAWNVDGTHVPLASFDMKGIYTWILTQIMLFFGKKTIFALYLNVIIQTIDVLLIYGCFRFVLGKLFSSIIAIGISSVPFFYETISDISPYNFTNCFILICIYLVILAVYLCIKGILYAKKCSDENIESSVDEDETDENDETDEIDESVDAPAEEVIDQTIEQSKEKSDESNNTSDQSEGTKIEIPVPEKIEPPLPMPKKHVKKEMNYAFEPKFDMMHYDHEDMTGKDFYDIE